MIGTIKYEKNITPIISIVDTSDSGMISKLKFYQYNLIERTGWELYREISQQMTMYKFGFINKSINENMNVNFNVVQIPLMPTTKSTEIQRLETIKVLAKIKSDLCILGKNQHVLVSSNGLPVNAGIIIGYALHKRQNIQLSYLSRDITFSHGQGGKIIEFKETMSADNVSLGKSVSLYVYIQAKSRDDGISAFHEYEKQKKSSDVCKISFVNRDNYNETFDMELSARYLVDRIIEYHEDFKKKGYTKISVHLFYNGFWGLALLLGNQMPTTFPIRLYDYEATKQRYYDSFLLEPNIFNL